jgi:hypothetical protein
MRAAPAPAVGGHQEGAQYRAAAVCGKSIVETKLSAVSRQLSAFSCWDLNVWLKAES